MLIPSAITRRLYAAGSLANDAGGFTFALVNRLTDATLTRVVRLLVDGADVPLDDLTFERDGAVLRAVDVTPGRPVEFPHRATARVRALHRALTPGEHRLRISVETRPFGAVEVTAVDVVADACQPLPPPDHIPYDRDDSANLAPAMIGARQRWVEARTGTRLSHLWRYTLDPADVRNNTENFAGAAQVPIGFAGPLRVDGEHARGDFVIPLATTEGSLVASYSRGMKVLTLAGGARCTIVDDRMQRAPAFGLASAREARSFARWVAEHEGEIRRVAEGTSRVARLLEIETYLASRFAFLRFDFSTGDAAGQNMVSKATAAACDWILANAPGVDRFYLESNLATDKKASFVNTLRTRGKRVTAEAVIPRELLERHLRVTPEALRDHGLVAQLGAMLAGASSNGLHAANAIAAIFIATGQDVANVAESAVGMVHGDVTPGGDLYISLTLPSLIVATHGGGTGLATQRECLEILGCVGRGTVNKLAEIVAAAALAGELSLAAAISSEEWVVAHERYGRNR